jgi:hypothetical protein
MTERAVGTSGYRFTGISLEDLEFQAGRAGDGSREVAFRFARSEDFNEGAGELHLRLTMEITEIPDGALPERDFQRPASGLWIRFSMLGHFAKVGDTPLAFAEFARINAPVLMFPFMRELVVALTSRSDGGTVVLPPVNLAELLNAPSDAAPAVAEKTITPR